MIGIQKIVDDWISGVNRDLITSYKQSGLRASGNWPQGLEFPNRIDVDKVNVKIRGYAYTEQLVNGRSPNKSQDPIKLKAFVGWAGSTWLKDWVNRKGINASPFAIAWKIAREGIKVPNANNDGKLLSRVLTKKRYFELARSIGGAIITDIKTGIR